MDSEAFDQGRIARASDATAAAAEALLARERACGKALTDPTRHRIFSICSVREACPKELSDELNIPLTNVEYHVRWLLGRTPANSVPLIELVDTDSRRGGTQHFYRAIESPHVRMDAAESQSREEREQLTAAIVPSVIGDLEGALAAGTIDNHVQRTLLRFHGELDDQGMRQYAMELEAVYERLRTIAAESQVRIIEGSRGFPVATSSTAYPIPQLYWMGA